MNNVKQIDQEYNTAILQLYKNKVRARIKFFAFVVLIAVVFAMVVQGVVLASSF